MGLSPTQVVELLRVELESRSLPQRRKAFYAVFDPAATFLLSLRYENLFEPADGQPDGYVFRCKGCRKVIPRLSRVVHHADHKREFEKIGSE